MGSFPGPAPAEVGSSSFPSRSSECLVHRELFTGSLLRDVIRSLNSLGALHWRYWKDATYILRIVSNRRSNNFRSILLSRSSECRHQFQRGPREDFAALDVCDPFSLPIDAGDAGWHFRSFSPRDSCRLVYYPNRIETRWVPPSHRRAQDVRWSVTRMSLRRYHCSAGASPQARASFEPQQAGDRTRCGEYTCPIARFRDIEDTVASSFQSLRSCPSNFRRAFFQPT